MKNVFYIVTVIFLTVIGLTVNAKPRCQGFNNYDNKVTIVFTDNQAKDKYTVSDVKLIPSSWSEKEYPATSVEVTVKKGVATVTLTFPHVTQFSNPQVTLRINGKKSKFKVCQWDISMKKMKMYLVMLVVSMLLPMRVSAQTVKGKLVDESNHPLPYANVVLLSLPDSAFVSGTISGEDGLFKLEATSVNQIVKISSIGYKTVYKPTTPANMGIVQLVSDVRMLGEVVVKANLPVTRIKNDALETNVQGTVLSKAGTAEDVLAHIPGLQKKADGFEVLGKGSPLIYINGRKLRDIAELDQLTSEEIKSVEVVRNPGARYDATVGAVVRIRTVKRQGDGFGVSLRSSYDQSQNSDFVEQADVNYRHNGLDVFAMVRFDKTTSLQNDILEQTAFTDTIWTQKNYQHSNTDSRSIDGRIGFNYDFNEYHSIGVRYDLSNALHTDMFTAFDSEIQADGLPYDILYSTIAADAKSQPEHQLNI